MVHATFLIQHDNLTYSAASGYFDAKEQAHQKTWDYAQCEKNHLCTCYVNGIASGFVSRHGDKQIYGD